MRSIISALRRSGNIVFGFYRAFAGGLLLLVVASCGGGGGGGSAPAPNRAPTALPSSVSTNEDQTVSGTLGGSDPDGDALTYIIGVQPTKGAVSVNGAVFSYAPAANFSGADQFAFYTSDGRLTSVAATVSIVVAPVNDPPTVAVSGPPEADGRSNVSFAITAADVDGDALTLGVRQVAGTAASTGLAGSTLALAVPDSQIAETLSFEVSARDAVSSGTAALALRVLPLAPTGNLRTLRGSRSAQGLHLVITGDGYTINEQTKLRGDAAALAATVLDDPEIGAYSNAWNVHVLDKASAESGVDIPSQSIVRDTAFDGTLDCAGTARLLCVNASKVFTAVAAEFPAYTQVLVTSNTDIYGGSGGAVAVSSRHSLAPLIALHEMGHSFAGLVDEYLDPALDTGPIANFSEANTPNATAITDLSQVKWRHWFANPNTVPRNANEPGVGLFEGALYRPTGYYRPMFDSFMRGLNANIGSVNAEQWVKSVYRRLGAVRTTAPTAPTLTILAGTTVQLAVTPSLGAPLQQTRWYENGVEIVTARGSLSYVCCTPSTGTRRVRVSVSEVSGLVRDPAPGPALFDRTWQVTFN